MCLLFSSKTDILRTYYITALRHKKTTEILHKYKVDFNYTTCNIFNDLQQFTKLISPPFFADHIAYNLVAAPSYCVRV